MSIVHNQFTIEKIESLITKNLRKGLIVNLSLFL